MREQAQAVVLRGLGAAGLEIGEVGDGRWLTVLSGDHKRTIPVLIEVHDRTLRVTSLFAGVPDEGHAAVYRILLQRNQRPGPVHFALDDAGDLILTGTVPLAALDDRAFDELLGAVLMLADETYDQVLRTGFATYLAGEQRWRERRGLPPNPIGDPLPPKPPQ